MNLTFSPLIIFTLKFTCVNQQNAQVTPISCKCSVAVKNTNANLNTHDFEYWFKGLKGKSIFTNCDRWYSTGVSTHCNCLNFLSTNTCWLISRTLVCKVKMEIGWREPPKQTVQNNWLHNKTISAKNYGCFETVEAWFVFIYIAEIYFYRCFAHIFLMNYCGYPRSTIKCSKNNKTLPFTRVLYSLILSTQKGSP